MSWASLLALGDHPGLMFIAVLLGAPICVWMGSVFFDDWAHFRYSLRLWFQPDWLSVFRGEWAEDQWESLRLALFFVCCGGVLACSYALAAAVL